MNDLIKDPSDRLWRSFDDMLQDGNPDLLQENANVDGKSPMG
ncbi:hypothetical protein CM49_03369 [Paenibacillus sp. P1XP2]|nr:hypothetical protein CM49_03369 [Paenibacillus sp. P1XP2]